MRREKETVKTGSTAKCPRPGEISGPQAAGPGEARVTLEVELKD